MTDTIARQLETPSRTAQPAGMSWEKLGKNWQLHYLL
jgi:hypothetical protein